MDYLFDNNPHIVLPTISFVKPVLSAPSTAASNGYGGGDMADWVSTDRKLYSRGAEIRRHEKFLERQKDRRRLHEKLCIERKTKIRVGKQWPPRGTLKLNEETEQLVAGDRNRILYRISNPLSSDGQFPIKNGHQQQHQERLQQNIHHNPSSTTTLNSFPDTLLKNINNSNAFLDFHFSSADVDPLSPGTPVSPPRSENTVRELMRAYENTNQYHDHHNDDISVKTLMKEKELKEYNELKGVNQNGTKSLKKISSSSSIKDQSQLQRDADEARIKGISESLVRLKFRKVPLDIPTGTPLETKKGGVFQGSGGGDVDDKSVLTNQTSDSSINPLSITTSLSVARLDTLSSSQQNQHVNSVNGSSVGPNKSIRGGNTSPSSSRSSSKSRVRKKDDDALEVFIPCCMLTCSNESCFWSPEEKKAYCAVCWGKVPFHVTVGIRVVQEEMKNRQHHPRGDALPNDAEDDRGDLNGLSLISSSYTEMTEREQFGISPNSSHTFQNFFEQQNHDLSEPLSINAIPTPPPMRQQSNKGGVVISDQRSPNRMMGGLKTIPLLSSQPLFEDGLALPPPTNQDPSSSSFLLEPRSSQQLKHRTKSGKYFKNIRRGIGLTSDETLKLLKENKKMNQSSVQDSEATCLYHDDTDENVHDDTEKEKGNLGDLPLHMHFSSIEPLPPYFAPGSVSESRLPLPLARAQLFVDNEVEPGVSLVSARRALNSPGVSQHINMSDSNLQSKEIADDKWYQNKQRSIAKHGADSTASDGNESVMSSSQDSGTKSYTIYGCSSRASSSRISTPIKSTEQDIDELKTAAVNIHFNKSSSPSSSSSTVLSPLEERSLNQKSIFVEGNSDFIQSRKIEKPKPSSPSSSKFHGKTGPSVCSENNSGKTSKTSCKIVSPNESESDVQMTTPVKHQGHEDIPPSMSPVKPSRIPSVMKRAGSENLELDPILSPQNLNSAV